MEVIFISKIQIPFLNTLKTGHIHIWTVGSAITNLQAKSGSRPEFQITLVVESLQMDEQIQK